MQERRFFYPSHQARATDRSAAYVRNTGWRFSGACSPKIHVILSRIPSVEPVPWHGVRRFAAWEMPAVQISGMGRSSLRNAASQAFLPPPRLPADFPPARHDGRGRAPRSFAEGTRLLPFALCAPAPHLFDEEAQAATSCRRPAPRRLRCLPSSPDVETTHKKRRTSFLQGSPP